MQEVCSATNDHRLRSVPGGMERRYTSVLSDDSLRRLKGWNNAVVAELFFSCIAK